jgi:hypothetical protein
MNQPLRYLPTEDLLIGREQSGVPIRRSGT